MVIARPPVATGNHQVPLDLVGLHQGGPLKVADGLLADLKENTPIGYCIVLALHDEMGSVVPAFR